MREPDPPTRAETPASTPAALGTYGFDLTSPEASAAALARFRYGARDDVGAPYVLPPFVAREDDEFRIRARGLAVDDARILQMHSVSLRGEMSGARDDQERHILMHLTRRGTWTFGRSEDRTAVSLSADDYLIRDSREAAYSTASQATGTLLVLPGSELGPMVGRRLVLGNAASPEGRLLSGHLHTLARIAPDVTPTAARAASAALVELVKGVIAGSVDHIEPLLAPALTRAAKDLAETRLTEPDLGIEMLARELYVSVRTLQRAFAAENETASGYIRRRRLEQARRELATSAVPPSLAELAAHWHFADSSHLIKTFKATYGQTPGEYLHSRAAAADSRAGRRGGSRRPRRLT